MVLARAQRRALALEIVKMITITNFHFETSQVHLAGVWPSSAPPALNQILGSSTANLKSLATQLSRWEHLLHTSEGCIPRETLDVGTHGARERPLRAVILVAAHRMGLRRRMRGWRRPEGAGGGGNVGVGVGGDPGGCSGGGGLGGNELGGGGGGEGEGGEGGRGGGGGNCRRPGLAWKGVLGRMSGRSCWSQA